MNLNTLPPLLRDNSKHTLFCSVSNLPFQLHHITPTLQIKKIVIYRTHPTFCSHSKRGKIIHALKLCKMSITSRGFPGGSVVKNLPSSIPGSGRSPEGNGNPLQLSCLKKSMDRGACPL